jgi:hypothetical protein
MAILVGATAILVAFGFQSPAATSTSLQPPASAEACSVTAPNGHAVSWATLAPSPLLHGNASISTELWPYGTVVVRSNGPGAVLSDGSLQMKFLWFKRPGAMTIQGRRLDGAAPPLRANFSHEFDGENFQPSALIFPTQGCWEITSRVGDASLTFVTRVVKVDEPANKG